MRLTAEMKYLFIPKGTKFTGLGKLGLMICNIFLLLLFYASKDASYRKLLYNQEIPKYRKMVEEYYNSISQMQEVSKKTLDQDFMEISKVIWVSSYLICISYLNKS